jgi:hypothetical protein
VAVTVGGGFQDCGAFGPLGRMQNQYVKLRVINGMEQLKSSLRTINSFRIN